MLVAVGKEAVVGVVGEEDVGAAPREIPTVSVLHPALTHSSPYIPRSPYTLSPLLCLFRMLIQCHFVEPLGSKEPKEEWKSWPGYLGVAQYHNNYYYPIMRAYVLHPSHT